MQIFYFSMSHVPSLTLTLANVCLISAALVSETPPTLQLNFEPAGKPGKDRDYYTEEKRNVCVVCGRDRDCIRKSIVPHEYRRSEKSVAALRGMCGSMQGIKLETVTEKMET